MKIPKVTIKITERGRQLLRLASALSGEKQYALFERLMQAEVARLESQRQQSANAGVLPPLARSV